MNNSQKTLLFCTALVAFAVAMRILSFENQWHNFASIGAISLFSGAIFKNKPFAFLLPIAALFATDLYLELRAGVGFYDASQYFVYGAVAVIVLMSKFMKRVSVLNVLGFSIASSVAFFLITNFGTWFAGYFATEAIPAMYPMNFGGLMTCLEMGIPFYRNTLISDVAFSGVMFGAYAVYQSMAARKMAINVK